LACNLSSFGNLESILNPLDAYVSL
jgi:hypothetical protein